jgi:NOL1/NOP2/fmu family ribosome biogenesis protein
MQQNKAAEWLRAELRRPTERPAIAYREDGSRIGVLISDLSYDGCRLSVSGEFAVGEKLTLVIMELGAELAAMVRWTATGQVGVRFIWEAETI